MLAPLGRITIILGLILLPLVTLSTLTVLYAQNSLYLNGQWQVSKCMVGMGLTGADEYLLTRATLSQNVLNLGKYLGFQEVLLRKSVEPREIAFDFIIPENSYFDIIFNRDLDQFDGLRFSNRSDLLSKQFTSNFDGKFLSRYPLPLQLPSSQWLRARLKTTSQGLELSIDNLSKTIPIDLQFSDGQIGFRSGLHGATIDNVSIWTSDEEWIGDNFSNSKYWIQLFLLNTIAIFLIGFLYSKMIISSTDTNSPKFLFPWVLFSIIGVASLGGWYAFDFFYYSRFIYPQTGITRPLSRDGEENFSFEPLRHRSSNVWYQLAGADPISLEGLKRLGYPMDRIWIGPIYCGPTMDKCHFTPELDTANSEISKISYRVLYIGTSQLLGSGAWDLQDTIVARVHRQLRAKLPVESINLSVSGSTAKELLTSYISQYQRLQPDLVVVNLSSNDLDEKNFANLIREFLNLNSSQKIKTVLIEEANSFEDEVTFDQLSARHQDLRSLGQEYKVPVLPLHDYLRGPEIQSSGSLWWDFVHMTSFGQEVAANWLGPKILDVLTSQPAKTKPMVRKAEKTP